MKAIFLLSSVLSLTSAFAQTDSVPLQNKKNNIHISFGFIHNRLIDEGYTDSKIRFQGTNSKGRIGFSRETLRYLFNFNIEASSGKVRSSRGNLPSSLTQGSVALDYFRRLKQYRLFDKEAILFAGINWTSRILHMENSPVIDNTDIFTTQGIYLGAVTRIRIDKKQDLQVAYLLPAVVSIGRILYSEADFSYHMRNNPVEFLLENSENTYFDLADLVHLRADYTKRFSRSASFSIGYAFTFANSAFKAPISYYSNEVLFGLIFKL